MVMAATIRGSFCSAILVGLMGLVACDRPTDGVFDEDCTRVVSLAILIVRPETLVGHKVQTNGYLSIKPLGVPVIYLTREHATTGDVLSGIVVLSEGLEGCLDRFVRIAGRFAWSPDSGEYIIRDVDRAMVIGSDSEASFMCYPAESPT
jgi:hypothetical protein